MIDLEIKLLSLFARDRTNKKEVSRLISIYRDDINNVGINGPFFNLLLGMRVFVTPGLIIEMLQYGFNLDHKNNKHVVHKAIINSINNYYSNDMYDVLEILLSSAYFLETIDDDKLIDILLKTDNEPDPIVVTLLLKYDKSNRIKKELLKKPPFCEKIKINNPEIYDLIIYSSSS